MMESYEEISTYRLRHPDTGVSSNINDGSIYQVSKSKCWQLIPTTDKLEYEAENRTRTVGGCCPLLPTLKVQKKG